MKIYKKVAKKLKKTFSPRQTKKKELTETKSDSESSSEYESEYGTGTGSGSDSDSDSSTSTTQIHQDVVVSKWRSLEVFQEIHRNVTNNSEGEPVMDTQFQAILLAATELFSEMNIVIDEVAPFFLPNWTIETFWSLYVSTNTNQTLQTDKTTITKDAKRLADHLTAMQVIDLVAWVEYFLKQMERAFPNENELKSSINEHFHLWLDLTEQDEKEVDVEFVADCLIWVKGVLIEAHQFAQQELLTELKKDAEQLLITIYTTNHTKSQTTEGRLISSLCEDIFSFFHIQLDTFRNHLSSKSKTFIQTIDVIVSCMRSKQLYYRNNFLQDVESCCIAANDFSRMSEQCEESLDLLIQDCNFLKENVERMETKKHELLELYTTDAVYAVQYSHMYIFEPIQNAIGDMLFGTEWETELTNNELTLTLVHTLGDYVADLEQFLDPILFAKLLEALVSATVLFYLKCLLNKAERHPSCSEKPYFVQLDRTLLRIMWDTRIMRQFFEDYLSSRQNVSPILSLVIKREFEILTILPELMTIAAGSSECNVSDFILLVHKKVGNLDLTRCFFGELWHLVNPTKEKEVLELINSMESGLRAFDLAKADCLSDQSYVPGLKLNEMIAEFCIRSERHMPVASNVLELELEKMKQKFKGSEEILGGMKQKLKGSEKKFEKMMKKIKDLNRIPETIQASSGTPKKEEDCVPEQSSHDPGSELNEKITEFFFQSKQHVLITSNQLEKKFGEMDHQFKGSEEILEDIRQRFKDLNKISESFKMSSQTLKLFQPSLKTPQLHHTVA